MLQQVIAIIIILFFVFRLSEQKKKKDINNKELVLWLIFWLLAAVAIIFIKELDRLVAWLGFSGGSINFLIYLAVLILFYLVFHLQLNLAKLDRNLTDIVRHLSLNDKK
ncbi:MAG: DUF2304 domain-containing protein [Patescibacteria group bacterium]|jgi:hypothetical protein